MTTLDLLWFIVAILAAYRLAYLLAVDNGPGYIFYRARAWVGRRWGEDSWQAEGIACVFCQSVWFGALAALGLNYTHLAIVRFALLALAVSGAVVIVHWLVMRLMRGIV